MRRAAGRPARSFYYVKRAFAPLKLILRASEDKKTVRVMGINDTANEVKANLMFGYAGFDGKIDENRVPVTLAPFSKTIVHEFAMPAGDAAKGVVFARMDGAPLALLRQIPFRGFEKHESRVTVESVKENGNDLVVTLKSEGYCHAVSLGFPANVRLSDEYFDMLPGDRVTVTVYGAKGSDGLSLRWL